MTRCRTACAVILAVVLAACGGETSHDPASWRGAPWGLRDAPLPEDRATIRDWFRELQGTPFFALPPFTIGDDREVGVDVNLPDGGEGSILAIPVLPGVLCSSPCSAGIDALEVVSGRDTKVANSLDPSAPVIFVAAAVDVDSQSGHSETISQLWFARPRGQWVFTIDASSPEMVRLLGQALADAGAGRAEQG